MLLIGCRQHDIDVHFTGFVLNPDSLGRCVCPLNDTPTRLRLGVQGLTPEGYPLTFSWELTVR
ncbi:hypothetical protein [Spirosoma radiotolerans]|uniref:hypothetical protein n=1 Tax=Spirosoma radiotolerans TaxID=1379870 RepID=UPI001D12E7AE|nr:hypothetical protein [Spirosoma radiotolerans]